MSYDHLVSLADGACAALVERLTCLGLEIFVGQTRRTDTPTLLPTPLPSYTHSFGSSTPLLILPPPAENLEVPIWEWSNVWHLHIGGKGFCLLWLHITLGLLTEQKLAVSLMLQLYTQIVYNRSSCYAV